MPQITKGKKTKESKEYSEDNGKADKLNYIHMKINKPKKRDKNREVTGDDVNSKLEI